MFRCKFVALSQKTDIFNCFNALFIKQKNMDKQVLASLQSAISNYITVYTAKTFRNTESYHEEQNN
jgi:hypothetical protein